MADVTHKAACVYKKVSNDTHTWPCANSNPNPNPNLGHVPCLVCLYIRPAVCIVTMPNLTLMTPLFKGLDVPTKVISSLYENATQL